MPGSILLLFIIWYTKFPLTDIDIFWWFIFLMIAYFVGDFIQIIATLPVIRNIFWIFIFANKHSWLFLLKDNPILKNNYIEDFKVQYKKFFKQDIKFDFNQKYKKIHFYWNSEVQKQTQYVFNKVYNVVREEDMVKASNEKYLFTRSCIIVFLMISIFGFCVKNQTVWLGFLIFSISFLYRNHRIARGFIKQIVLHFNNFKKWN